MRLEGVSEVHRPLHEADAGALEAFALRCADYALLVDGHAPTPEGARGLIHDAPPGTPLEHAWNVGFFRGERMIAYAGFVRDYPEQGTGYVGLLLLEPEVRGQGLGERIARGVEAFLHGQGMRAVRLSVVQANPRALTFWQRQGYRVTRLLPPRRFGDLTHVRHELEKPLRPQEAS